MKTNSIRFFPVAASVLFAVAASGYDPPVDTAGPLTVRIRQLGAGNYGQGGIAELRPETASPFSITLQNASGSPVKGTLRIKVTDRWRVDPSAPISFNVDAQSMAQVRVMVTPGEVTYNAHYPIHAYAEFEHQGSKLTAHPILVVETRFPNPPRPAPPFSWSAVPVHSKGEMGLWRLPVHREQVRTVSETQIATAAPEMVATAPTFQFGSSILRGELREAITMGVGLRPPAMRDRVIAARVEYPLELPAAPSIRFRFGAALSDQTRSAVTYRVRVAPFDAAQADDGALVLERSVDTKTWRVDEADLSRYAGQRIRLQLDALPSQDKESGEAYWAEPTVVTGSSTVQPPFPPQGPANSRALGSVTTEGTAYQVRVWPGSRGMLDAAVGFQSGEASLLFRGFQLRVLGDALEDTRSSSELVEAREEPAGNGHYRVRHRFRNWAGSFDVLGELWTEQSALRSRFWMENAPAPRPWMHVHLEDVAAGPWSGQAQRVYLGPGNVIQQPEAFKLNFGGHYLSTSFVGFDFPGGISMVQGVDIVPNNVEINPALRVYSLRTALEPTLTFIPVRDVWNGVKIWRDVNGLKAAGGVATKAGRFVFDLWGSGGGRYADAAANLARAARYGLTDSLVVWHRWQRWGYDYRLPDIYPPNPEQGTLEDFIGLVNVCKKNGILFGPHDNYVDFYADADDFSYQDIAFQPDGKPRRAWLNSGREAQSYRPRADRLRPFLERNVKMLRDGFAPTAYFIDVWTSTYPHDYWTHDGQFFDRMYTRKAWGEAYAWIREYLGGNAPAISEAGHDQLIGYLDGADAQVLRAEAPPAEGFIWPIKAAATERIPWYDAAHHDRFVLHGAGYPDRYVSGLDSRSHGIYSDDYITTEVLTGHPAMVAHAFGRDVVRKYWLLHGMMRGLAMRRIDGVGMAGGNLHRQQVKWDNGANVWVNRDPADWTVGEHTLPQYGYYASIPQQGGALETAIERRDGIIVEWSRSPSVLYVNARPPIFDPVQQRGRFMMDPGPDPRPARMNPERRPISFGPVTTDGACRLTPERDGLQITPLPNSSAFQVRMRWKSLPWRLREPQAIEALDENGNVIRQTAVQKDGDEITLGCAPDAFAYRLR